jgi:hypothetical protein
MGLWCRRHSGRTGRGGLDAGSGDGRDRVAGLGSAPVVAVVSGAAGVGGGAVGGRFVGNRLSLTRFTASDGLRRRR